MEDEVVAALPIRYSEKLAPNIHIHQFPLLNRPLQAPPSALASGRSITARIKPLARRLEIHVPTDSRPEVWNLQKSKELGVARREDDREKNHARKDKSEEEAQLNDIRLRSEEIMQQSVYMLGIVRDGTLHLHPISQSHQLRPTLTYLDILSQKQKRSHLGEDSDADDGPPPDPDDPAPPPVIKKEKKTGETREVQVTARKADETGGPVPGGISVTRREMLQLLRTEEDENWDELQFFDTSTSESEETLEEVFSQHAIALECKTSITRFLEHSVNRS